MTPDLFMALYHEAGCRYPSESIAVEDNEFSGIQHRENSLGIMSCRDLSKDSGSFLEPQTRPMSGLAVSKFKRVIFFLERRRTGHARFRQAPPILNLRESTTQLMQEKEHQPHLSIESENFSSVSLNTGASPPVSHRATPLKPSITSSHGDGNSNFSVDRGYTDYGSPFTNQCYCSKKRKQRKKKVVRIPATSSTTADVPRDEFSWRKYGRKPIKGSPYPRGYYWCSSVRGCPARKHVEKAVDDPTMLIVTYEGEHNHFLPLSSVLPKVLEKK